MKWEWTYGPTLLPWNGHFQIFHTSEACLTFSLPENLGILAYEEVKRGFRQGSDVWKWLFHGNSVGP